MRKSGGGKVGAGLSIARRTAAEYSRLNDLGVYVPTPKPNAPPCSAHKNPTFLFTQPFRVTNPMSARHRRGRRRQQHDRSGSGPASNLIQARDTPESRPLPRIENLSASAAGVKLRPAGTSARGATGAAPVLSCPHDVLALGARAILPSSFAIIQLGAPNAPWRTTSTRSRLVNGSGDRQPRCRMTTPHRDVRLCARPSWR